MSARRAAVLALMAQGGAAGGRQAPQHACPPELRRCVVWDWLEDDEVDDMERLGMNSLAVIRAWRRWQAARRSYVADVGKPEAQACGPMGRPTLG